LKENFDKDPRLATVVGFLLDPDLTGHLKMTEQQ